MRVIFTRVSPSPGALGAALAAAGLAAGLGAGAGAGAQSTKGSNKYGLTRLGVGLGRC